MGFFSSSLESSSWSPSLPPLHVQDGETALAGAARNNCESAMDLLIQAGADKDAKDNVSGAFIIFRHSKFLAKLSFGVFFAFLICNFLRQHASSSSNVSFFIIGGLHCAHVCLAQRSRGSSGPPFECRR